MNSIILKAATRYLFPILVLVAIFLLFRGHHEPGGGFIAGLVISCAVVLILLTWDLERARETIRLDPLYYVVGGLSLAIGAGLAALLSGRSFLTGLWIEIEPAWLPAIKLGTPLIFDVGVFFVVFGITLTIVFALAESES